MQCTCPLCATCCHMRCSNGTSMHQHAITSSASSSNHSEMLKPDRLAGGVKLDIGNPVALAPAQAGLFILTLVGCRRSSE